MEDTYLILEEVPTNSPSYSPKKKYRANKLL